MKTKIVGMGNEEDINFIIVYKNKYFFEWLAEFMLKSFGMSNYNVIGESECRRGDWIDKKKQIKNFTDRHEIYKNKNARVDVFYGKRKVFIMINTPLKNKKKFGEVLGKISIWKKCKPANSRSLNAH